MVDLQLFCATIGQYLQLSNLAIYWPGIVCEHAAAGIALYC